MSRQTTRSAQKGQGHKQRTPATGSANAQLLAAQEAKREARHQRQLAAQAAAQRSRLVKTLRNIGLGVGLLVILMAGGLAFYMNEAGKPGLSVSQQPSPHIQDPKASHDVYDSDPPTSGPHLPGIAAWGVSATPVAKETQVHNLEDGGVIINYQPGLDKATIDRLEALTRTYDRDVLLTKYPGPTLSDPVVLTAWGRIDRLQTLDEVRIKRFVDAFRGKDHHRESGS